MRKMGNAVKNASWKRRAIQGISNCRVNKGAVCTPMKKGKIPAPIPQTITSNPGLVLKLKGGAEYPIPRNMKARRSKKTLMSVKTALNRLISVKAKNSAIPFLGETSPEAMGKSFFKLFALSFSWSMY